MFDNSLHKLNRAIHHQNVLLSEFQNYIGSGAIRLEAYTEGEDMQFMSAVVAKPPPLFLSLVIGDTIHNLRCSLDHLTSELLRTKKNGARTTFPLHETRVNLNDKMSKGALGAEFPELIDVIVNQLKCYDTGDVCMWNIGHFDNIDKHNLLIPILSVSRIVGASFHTEHQHVVHSSLTVGEGNRIVGFQSQSPLPFVIDNPGKPQAALLFPEGKAIPRHDIIFSLRKMTELVLQAINLFGRSYSADWTDKSIGYSDPGK